MQFTIRAVLAGTEAKNPRLINSSVAELPILRATRNFILAKLGKLMCHKDTIRILAFAVGGLAPLWAQSMDLAWRPIGTTVIGQGRAGFSGEAVAGLWYTADGTSLEVQLRDGRLFRRSLTDENWVATANPSPRVQAPSAGVPDSEAEEGLRVFEDPQSRFSLYGLGKSLWKSEDLGRHWRNLTQAGPINLVGSNVRQISFSPTNTGHIAIGTDEGIWFSGDAGQSWVGLNEGLPNLRIAKILATPSGGRGLLAVWSDGMIVEWVPGRKDAWAARGQAAEWRNQISWSDPAKPLLRIASDGKSLRRTLNGGRNWDELGEGLAGGTIYGVAADWRAKAVYAATERGLFFTTTDLEAGGTAPPWIRLEGNLPARPVLDVYLDEASNFLYVSLAGEGVFLAQAPHRLRQPQLVSSGDLAMHATAPGALLTLVGAKVSAARMGGKPVRVLSASGSESQLQVPFDIAPPTVAVEIETTGAQYQLQVEVAATSPVIFTDREGAPLLVDSFTGELLDPATPLVAGRKVQILMTGLGQVDPVWPMGMAAPLENAPRVVAPVRVWLNGKTLTVVRSELAGGYVGFYLVEVDLPPVLDEGIAPMAVEAGGRMSNTILVRTASR